jgi:hypothetical protein
VASSRSRIAEKEEKPPSRLVPKKSFIPPYIQKKASYPFPSPYAK